MLRINQRLRGAGKLAANEDLESMEIPTGLPIVNLHTNAGDEEPMSRVYTASN